MLFQTIRAFVTVLVLAMNVHATDRPNILWITSEDNGPELGCYGDTYATTPNLDRLAASGLRFNNCWSNAPVCAPARTTIITGLWPTSTGAMHMRSQVKLPDGFLLLPQYMRQSGYYCSNNEKEDYNVATVGKVWDESSKKAHWRNRQVGQPFFSVFNITTSHESQIRVRPHQLVHDPAEAPIPTYHPDLPEVRHDWAQYYDKLTEMDVRVGRILAELDADGLREDTIIFYFGDHGSGMPRSKRWLYQSGLRVPLIVVVPEKFKPLANRPLEPGTATDDLVSFIDLVPTMLSLAGAQIPEQLQGHVFLGPQKTEANKYLFGFRDRMDERYDCSRSVRDDRYLYIRNWMPHRAQGQYLDYMFQTPTTRGWFEAYRSKQTNNVQSSFWLPKPSEELYDLTNDPEQVVNLAGQSVHQSTMDRMRQALKKWMLESRDLGLMPESEMFARSGDDAPWTIGHDDARYPIEEIEKSADAATRYDAGQNSPPQDSDSSDDVTRYWDATANLVRGVRGERVELKMIRDRMVAEKSSMVRIVLAETMARFGEPADRQPAIDALLEIADAGRSGLFNGIAAMNALAHCECTQDEMRGRLAVLSIDVPLPHQRYSPYLMQLKKDLQSQLRGQGE
jgi:arylsulfatase A-like enzyme